MTVFASNAGDVGRGAAMDVATSRRLVIVSVPFVRLVRMSLSDLVLGTLREDDDVVIVSPFAEAAGFQRSFAAHDLTFLKWTPPRLSRGSRALLAASELMRRNGYWRRFRNSGMAYYVENELTVHGMNGADRRLPPGRAAVFRFFSVMGQWPAAWRIADQMLGSSWCRFPALETLASRYADVTLIQSANWGIQDRALSRLSRDQGWLRVMLPYTVDQLDVNGYLLNDFDAVCAQGPFEARAARTLHAIPATKVHEVGSAWLRRLDQMRDQALSERRPPFVMYAGASALYFPRASELEGLARIAALIAAEHPGLQLVYRPVPDDEAARREIEEFCARLPGVSIQWPAITEIGLDGNADIDVHATLEAYVRNILGCRALVMSSVTSLAIDVARINRCGVVSNMVDPRGVLARRKTHLLHRPWFSALRVAHTHEELVAATRSLLNDPIASEAAAEALGHDWDFPHQEFRSRFRAALRANAPRASRGRP